MKIFPAHKTTLILTTFFMASGFTAPASQQPSIGQGTLKVAPSVNAKYKKYLQLDEPLAFAVSTDGRASSGSFCQQPGTCLDINGPQLAIDQCNQASASKSACKLFAIGRDVVWNGRISLKSNVGTGPLTLALPVDQKFQKYMALVEPLAFAVSTDGLRSSGSFCQAPGTCQDTDGPTIALNQCRASAGPQDAPCKIFALGFDIVWDGSVRLAEVAPTVSPVAAPPVTTSAPLPKPPRQVPPTTSSRVRSSKAFRDLEDDIRRSQNPPTSP